MNIVLIGMPGSGKSTVGVVLAKILGYHFIDSDILIQEREGKLLNEIIMEKGRKEFLRIEGEVNASIRVDNTIIATGGSAVYSEKAMIHFQNEAIIVYLKLSYENIEQRLGDINERGVAFKRYMTLADIYEERCPLYEKYACYTVGLDGVSVEEAVYKIKEIVNL